MTDTLVSEHGTLPLAPVDRSRSWLVRLMNWASRKRYGKTPMAFRVLYARAPFIAYLSLALYWARLRALRLDGELAYLVQVAIAMFRGCTFCTDLHLAEVARTRLGLVRFRALSGFEESSEFTAREKAALAYARAVCVSLHVADDVWRGLSAHFGERERVEIVWLCALESYYNCMALPLRIGSDGIADLTRA
jgi:alkylhydroperoxidase family enzyme